MYVLGKYDFMYKSNRRHQGPSIYIDLGLGGAVRKRTKLCRTSAEVWGRSAQLKTDVTSRFLLFDASSLSSRWQVPLAHPVPDR